MLMVKIYFPFSENEDNFDWAKYLMEGEDFDTGPYPDTPVSQSEPTYYTYSNKDHRMSYYI